MVSTSASMAGVLIAVGRAAWRRSPAVVYRDVEIFLAVPARKTILSLRSMFTHYSPQNRAERLIAAGRTVLSGFFLLALWFDPTEPSAQAQVVHGILTGYLIYSLVLVVFIWRRNMPLGAIHIVTHTLDLLVFAVIMFFTKGPGSPFFAYFVFLLVCATLRWQWRGTVLTALTALAAVTMMAVYAIGIMHDPNFELNLFIIRTVYLAVVAVLLGYLGAHEQKLRYGLLKLASWPHPVQEEIQAILATTMRQAADILGAPRLLLVWEDEDEPYLYLALWTEEGFFFNQEAPGVFGTVVAEPLAERNFICSDLNDPEPKTVHDSAAGLQRWQGNPLHPALRERFAIATVLGLKITGKEFTGYLLALDKERMTTDDIVLGKITAHEVASRLEQFYLLQKLREAAASEERCRLARDLHDGLLQSLTGAVLQLETVIRSLQDDPQTARQRLVDVQRLITAEQQDLRRQIIEMKPGVAALPRMMDADLRVRLQELAGRLKRHWGLEVEMHLPEDPVGIPDSLAQELYFIVHEALINAARHAGASRVRVDFAGGADRMKVAVDDNGKGFPFQGRMELAELMAMNLGPVTLKERIAALDGALTIVSSESGAHLEIVLPLPQ